MKTFPLIKDLVTDVSFNYEKAKTIPAFKPRPKEADGTRRMYQEDVDRVQEFHKCIECFLCQNVCHVIRDHEENKPAFAGPRFFVRLAALEMHPLDTNDRHGADQAARPASATATSPSAAPRSARSTSTSPTTRSSRSRSASSPSIYDPVVWVWRKLTRRTLSAARRGGRGNAPGRGGGGRPRGTR